MSLVSVILSTYNEPCSMISQSIDSILKQSFGDLEIIMINDNPARADLDVLLADYAQKDDRILYVKHKQNMGLVASLNEGIRLAKGDFIARMDADDISDLNRIQRQYAFICRHGYDMIGSCIVKVDENDHEIGELLLPSFHEEILRFMKYGSCVLHPTWLVKKEVYEALNGYRNIVACEDYDFLLRAINAGFRLGNIPEVGLRYRVRSASISQSTNALQMLTMHYLARFFDTGYISDIEEVKAYLLSEAYKKDKAQFEKYENAKAACRKGNLFMLPCMVTNKYFYVNLLAHMKQKQRKKYRVLPGCEL